MDAPTDEAATYVSEPTDIFITARALGINYLWPIIFLRHWLCV